MAIEIVKVPDIGAESAEVIEILVVVGEELEAEQSLLALESDKASLEVPSPLAGKVVAIHVAVGDQLSEGMNLIELELASGSDTEAVTVSVPVVPVPGQAAPVAAQETVDASDAVATEHLYVLPDIGADEAEIIEVAVSVGDEVAEGDSIVVAESDKASLEVPAEAAGTVVALHVSEGDKVQPGSDLVSLRVLAEPAIAEPEPLVVDDASVPILEERVEQPTATLSASAVVELAVPDMGSDSAEIIEIPVAVGDRVEEGDTLAVVETDKASVEVPAELGGEITALHIDVGGKIAQGDKLVTLVSAQIPSAAVPAQAAADKTATKKDQKSAVPAAPKQLSQTSAAPSNTGVYAGPSVRKLARELGVDLAVVKPSGLRGRVLKDDLKAYVKLQLQSSKSAANISSGTGIPEIPPLDWSKYGEIDVRSMSRIDKVTAVNMVRNWLNVPHVTQFDDADVTELETYRGYLKPEGLSRAVKMTPLAFLLRASAIALKENPKFNTALHENGQDLVERKFFHVSVAVDTPQGLMVPVIRDVDQKDIWQLAAEVSSLASKAKDGKLSPKEMQGACFTISSLGAIGGTGFTPIVPAPQVGILGVSKTSVQPVWDGTNFVPRKMMPLALSYDHRVVNGADAGKFMTCLVAVLGDLDRIWNG